MNGAGEAALGKGPGLRPLVTYGLLAYLYTWLLAGPNVLAARGWIDMPVQHWLEPVAAFGPFIAALLVLRSHRDHDGAAGLLGSLCHWRVGMGPAVLAAGSPVVLLLAAVLAVALAGGELVDAERGGVGVLLTAAGLADLLLVGALLQALGEEPGWRGFMLPRLRRRFGPLAASAALFPVWLLWHLPMFLSRPEFGVAQWLGFSVGIFAASIWLTMIWEATGSVLMAVVWHAMVNVCRGIALALSPTLFLAISNAVLVGAACIVIYWWWRRRRVSPVPKSRAT
jgi:membrane protease YdiL (CAAX protease family)